MTHRLPRKPIAGMIAALSLVGLVGCSSDKKSTDTTVAVEASTETTAAAEAPTETTAAAAAEAPTTEAHAEEGHETTAAAAADGATTVAAAASGEAAAANTYTLAEWSLTGNATLPAGPIDLSVVNGGKFPHEFLVIKGTTYEKAPKNDKGTVLEDQLPAGSVIGELENLAPGSTTKLSVTLEPGEYLFVCNIEFGPNSHAGKGQRLNVTVA